MSAAALLARDLTLISHAPSYCLDEGEGESPPCAKSGLILEC